MSSWLARDWPAKALRRKIRHQPAMRFSHAAPTGMKAWVMGDARVVLQPVAHGTTQVAGQIVGDQEEIAVRIRLVERLQQGKVAAGVARGGGLGQCLAVPDAQRPVDPDLVRSALIVEGHLAAVAIGGPARRRREVAWGSGRYGAAFVDADDRRARRRRGGERDDPGPCGTLGRSPGLCSW